MKSTTMIWFISLSFYFLLMSQYEYVEGSSSSSSATAVASSSAGSTLTCDAVHTLVHSLTKGLQNAALFQKIVGAGISAEEAVEIVVSAFDITLTKLSVSSSAILGIQKDFERYMFNAGVSSSVSVYAEAVAECLIFGLLESGYMTDSNIYAETKSFFSTFLISLTEVATSDGISVIPSSEAQASATSSAEASATSSAQASATSSTQASATSSAQADSGAASSAAYASAENYLSNEDISTLISILSNGLQNAAIFTDIIEEGMLAEQSIQIVYSALQITLTKMSVSSSATAGIQNNFMNYIFNIGASVSVSVYAQVIATCLIYGLIDSGDLTFNNQYDVLKEFFSIFLKVMTNVATSDGINLI